jgi:hypothetical protein
LSEFFKKSIVGQYHRNYRDDQGMVSDVCEMADSWKILWLDESGFINKAGKSLRLEGKIKISS